ncbi:phosphopantothenoylcysteine decarboxylase subunit VHS3-like isoform X2 [Chenopodium quinoa]|uniref:phosphopantothenoylcysteine decarboxylase subunit VHS3-like isoform X2 n=1 Tax=Chenopodium quinoa TaxID=63459 RepID=UPI000B772441|nr:phosphopantothenoylcysteine decarboxylase subunit VHS3-like isoform X2 [Chenopodium quinoa]
MTLLCHICQSPTLWSGSGPKFGPTISVCPTCLGAKNDARHHNNNARDINMGDGRVVADEDLDEDDNDDDEEEDDNDDDDDDDGDDGFEDGDHSDNDGDEHEDDEENQVVPWSYSVSHPR